MTRMQLWAEIQSKKLDMKVSGKSTTISELIDRKTAKDYQAVGKIISKPEHAAHVLEASLSGKGVPEGMARAWTAKFLKMSDGDFQQDSGRNFTADGQAATGIYRGVLER